MMKLSEELKFEVSAFCISYLTDRFTSERGLFRFAVSQTDVRLLQSQIASKAASQRDDFDPHIVAEVLQTTLKEMDSPLFHEVYQDIVATELHENDYDWNKSSILKWMQKMPLKKRSLMHSYFRLLSRLSSLEESDASLMQLAYSICPPLCRPLTSAYMSLRHMEDLKKIRPCLLFIVDNFSDLFNSSKSFYSLTGIIHSDSEKSIDGAGASSAMAVDQPPPSPSHTAAIKPLSGPPSGQEGNEATAVSFGSFVKPSLIVSIPGGSSSMTTPMSPGETALRHEDIIQVIHGTSDGAMETDGPVFNRENYSDSEWKIFHALVCVKVASFVDLSDKETNQFIASEAGGDAYHIAMQAWNARVSMNSGYSPAKAEGSGAAPSSSSSAAGSIGSMDKTSSASSSVSSSFSSTAKSIARRNRRRKLVAECKGLRVKIFEFEQSFLLKNNRMPRSQERGVMQEAYAKYKDLKRDIRDTAARDVERVVRAFLARRRVLKMRKDSPAKSTASAATATSSKTLSDPESFDYEAMKAQHILKFRELAESKKELKRKLKKFDEDFFDKYKRVPKKVDKEVIRPMYQKYHEVKNALEALKVVLESFGALPEDILSEAPASPTTSSDRKSINKDKEKDSESKTSSTSSKAAVSSQGWVGNGSGSGSGSGAADNSAASAGNKDNKKKSSYEDLQQEKRNLHEYLKVYERDFNQKHGRPVMKNEDIQPVANEYQRYKELKALLKDMKPA